MGSKHIEEFEVGELEDVVFDADRDNNGEGVPVDEMIKMLKKIGLEPV